VCTASRELLLLLVVVPRMLLLVLPLLPLVHASTGALGMDTCPGRLVLLRPVRPPACRTAQVLPVLPLLLSLLLGACDWCWRNAA
jgi:hypothetical protein